MFNRDLLLFLAQRIYHSTTTKNERRGGGGGGGGVRVVCISDTHNSHHAQPALPPGDILIHAGDLTHSGTTAELRDALDWLSSHPHPVKIFIAGNHDAALADPQTRQHLLSSYSSTTLIYLENTATEVTTLSGRTLSVFGSPYTPKHGSWPFQYPRIAPGAARSVRDTTPWWSSGSIPLSADIVVTHGPPFAHLDLGRTGCYALLTALWRVRPSLHVCGHIHAARGVERLAWDDAQAVYEDVCAGKAGWFGLLSLVWYAVVARLGWKSHSRREGGQTVLVNAAAVGGLRDDERKGAIVVEL